MEFEILGPLVVRVGDDHARLGAAKPRALLVRLLVADGRPVPATRLAEDLWDGQPPRSAAQTLQTYVSQLRKALGADRVVTVAGGYRVVVGDGELDARVFEAAVADARRALAAGDAAGASAEATAALARWRGPALVDAAGASWADAEIARLDELRLVATELLLEARLALGDHTGVVAAAELAVTEHPLRERPWALLMTALYRDGRQADALRAFQRLRRHLGEELGIEPSRELQDLEGRVLRQEPGLDGPTGRGLGRSRDLPTGVVTFLLTDVVGSTRMWEAAPAAMEQALARHDVLVADVVVSNQGVVLKSRGEGDSSFSVFQRATDAVAAAVDLRDCLAAERWPTAAPIELRMAIHSGEAVERDGDYYGRTVNRAARLRAAAPAGQVVVSQATAELTIDDLPAGHRLSPLGVQALRDLERPETVFVVAPVGEPVGAGLPEIEAGRVPLPHRLAVVPTMGFVGRLAEQEVLVAAHKLAVEGTGRVVVVAGEPGIGKTSLAADLARRAHDAGAAVAYGRSDDEAGVPYRPWLESLGHLVDHVPAGSLQRLGDRRLADLSRLVPAVADRVPGVLASSPGDPDADRWSVFAAVSALVASLTADGPLVLVLDDLQWADRASLQLLAHVVDGARALPLLVVATYRDNELSVDHPLIGVLATFRRDGVVDRVPLRGLGDHEVVEMIETATGRPLGADALGFVQAVRRETDGNPFFTTELLRHLAETGAVYLDEAGRWVPRGDLDGAGLPDSVREVVGRRVRNLGVDVEQVLRVGAVIGREFDLTTLAAATTLGAATVLDAIERAEVAGLVMGGDAGRYSFAHALVAHTVYADLTPTRRGVLHRQVAEAIEGLDDAATRSAELARHWAAATAPADLGKAVGYAQQAGDAAMRSLAPDEARRWYGQAVELVAPLGDAALRQRCDLLVRLGRAQRQADDPVHRATLLDAARAAQRLGDAGLLARAALANSQGFVGHLDERIDERHECLEAALAAYPPEDSVVRARLLACLAAELRGVGRVERCRGLVDDAIAMARRLGDVRLLVAVLSQAAFALWVPDSLRERLALTGEAVDRATEVGDPHLRHVAINWRVHALVEAAEIDEARRGLAEMQAIAQDTGLPSVQWTNRSYRGALALLVGDVATAEDLANEAVATGDGVGSFDAQTIRLAIVAASERHRGRPMVDRLLLRGYLDRLTQLAGEASPVHVLRLQLALEHLEIGDPSMAVAALADAQAEGFRTGFIGWLGMVSLLAELAVRVGTDEQIEALHDLIAPYDDQVASCGAFWLGSAAHYVAVLAARLGRADDASAAFARADAANEAIGAPFFLAQTRVAWARLLLDRRAPGDAEQATELLTQALAGARARGCHGLVRDAEALLADLTG